MSTMKKEKAGNSKETVTRGAGTLRGTPKKEPGTRSKNAGARSKDSGTRSREGPTQKSLLSKKSPKTRPKNTPMSYKSHKSFKDRNQTEDVYNEELLNRMSKALTHNPWYHGLMPRDEIEDLLKNDGDFLVRKTEVNTHVRYAATVMYKNRIRHILFNFKNDLWSLRDLKRPTVTELIEAHVNDKVPVMSDGTLLINAVPRPVFYILHEHIELKQRLGGGAFGDVYAAALKNKDDTTIDVAVKRLKGMMHKKQRAEFVKEAKLMRRFDHPNIVKMYGVAPQEEPILSGEAPMKPPEDTPTVIASVMDLCFTQNPDERPDFEVLFKLVAPNEKPPLDNFESYGP
ncbi:Tyrosine-protein kinase [Aphelenchoides besseyi]|nr:Tyrosine-protein kinase [Aphelenchoides besseyi]